MGSSRIPVSLREALSPRRAQARRRIAALSVDVLRNLLLILFLFRITRRVFYQIRGYGPLGTIAHLYASARKALYTYFLRLPGVRSRVEQQISTSLASLESKLVPSDPTISHFTTLPLQGWGKDRVLEELGRLDSMKRTRWEDGRVSGAVYHGGDELLDIQSNAFRRFGVSNPIHPDVFPGVRKMEAEIVAMVLAMFHAPKGAAGVTTSGGTESILMACLSARQKAYQERGITAPEMILPETAHAAFEKAGEYFKIKVHHVPCPAPSHKVSVTHVRRLINPNTILLVGSAPSFPHGIIDPISSLSSLALKYKLPLHVDCCLGSFLMPFLGKAGFEAPPFDFTLPGVTSISVDTHKYGFAPKGNSTVLYRTKELRRYQYFISPDWTGGVYASPSIAGSRPGALIAGCWASMMSMGEEGYVSTCHKIVGCAKRLESVIRDDGELSKDIKIVGKPLVSVIAFATVEGVEIDIYDVADGMSARGWHLNALQNPPAVHVAVTLPIVSAMDDLINDLKTVVGDVREKARSRGGLMTGKGKQKKGDVAALYGVAGALPDKTVVRQLAAGFLDCLYKA